MSPYIHENIPTDPAEIIRWRKAKEELPPEGLKVEVRNRNGKVLSSTRMSWHYHIQGLIRWHDGGDHRSQPSFWRYVVPEPDLVERHLPVFGGHNYAHDDIIESLEKEVQNLKAVLEKIALELPPVMTLEKAIQYNRALAQEALISPPDLVTPKILQLQTALDIAQAEIERLHSNQKLWRARVIVKADRNYPPRYSVLVPLWHPRHKILVREESLPEHMRDLDKDRPLYARVNLNANSANEIYFEDWEYEPV